MIIDNINNHKIIVFGGEHYNPLGAIRSFGEKGINPIAVIYPSGSKQTVASASKYISCLHKVQSMQDGYNLIVETYGNELEKPFVITCDDLSTSYLDIHFDEIRDRFLFYNATKNGMLTYFMDKNNINITARNTGFTVAPTHVVQKGEIPIGLEYPVITKAISSNSGAWKADVFICYNEHELIEAYKKIKGDTILLQKYINKTNELCIDGFSINDGQDMIITIAATYDYILPGKYSTFFTIKNLEDQQLWNQIHNLIKTIKYNGIFCIEFLVGDDGKLYFLEVNLRNSGWSYASTCAGMNMPYYWCISMLEGSIPQEAYSTIPENFKAMVEISDFKTRVIGRQINLFKWIHQMRQCSCLFYYNKQDTKPFWSSIISKMRR